MRFNRKIIDYYLRSEDGKSIYRFFSEFNIHLKNKNHKEFQKIYNRIFLDKDFLSKEEILEKLECSYEIKKHNRELERNAAIKSVSSAGQLFSKYLKSLKKLYDLQEERETVLYVSDISMVLHSLYPEYFFPYFFDSHYFLLEEIFLDLGILVPEKPSRRNYEQKALYYFEICKSLYDFRSRYELSSIELNILIYGLTLNLRRELNIFELPQPGKVFISGATKKDAENILSDNSEEIHHWHGNENSNPGDIMLLYAVKPYSGILAVFRCLSRGDFEPFDYWSSRVWIGCKIIIPVITFSELQTDEIWKNKGIVKAHMQGIGGTACTKSEYEALLNILKNKKFDINKLPKIPEIGLSVEAEINSERDVETALLEPLLNKLGYSEKDWIRQLPVRMGRGERNYPDYALVPKNTKGEESCKIVAEAKFRISTRKQLLDAFFQAKSYALRLSCYGLILVAQEGIWYSLKENEFSFEKIVYMEWEKINHFDGFNKIKTLFEKGRRFT